MPITIVGMACRYADASSPEELWRNVLAQRAAFRRIPAVRLRIEDYLGNGPDSISSTEAAVIDGFEFDREHFKVSGASFRAADLSHWLALDVAAKAIADAGFELPSKSTGVIVGNTLTGEFSRSGLLRLRWPWVARVMAVALSAEGWSGTEVARFLTELEQRYKRPFPVPDEESLAGGLANTIAGRIANHFDLMGGAYTVDGACASSLLAVNNACTALEAGDLDVAVVGGVDLSLDPFELVGFSRTGALTRGPMRVFDEASAGFVPGEGCGFVVLMRTDDAAAEGIDQYAEIKGWAISSDGSGGLTRPGKAGQELALERAYARAGFGIDSVALFEGHGTGTTVGDATEIEALESSRRKAGAAPAGAAIGSIKANIGHTKAAAGMAGLIKATMAVRYQLLPPTSGCVKPHQKLRQPGSTLRTLSRTQMWPKSRPVRAGISAMGFGGINSHLVIEALPGASPITIAVEDLPVLITPAQDSELFILAADTRTELNLQMTSMAEIARRLSLCELTDLAAELARSYRGGAWRLAIVAATPTELATRLEAGLEREIGDHQIMVWEPENGLFLGHGDEPATVGLLFPGQGRKLDCSSGRWRQFPWVESPVSRPPTSTPMAAHQVDVVTSSLVGLDFLEHLGVVASVAVGHSLGEITAWSWAGALGAKHLLQLVATRGEIMDRTATAGGTMASVSVNASELAAMVAEINEPALTVAADNGPEQAVVSGPRPAVQAVMERAQQRGWRCRELEVAAAFHSPMVAAAGPELAAALNFRMQPLLSGVASTITGGWLEAEANLLDLLVEQLTSPVRFLEAVRALESEVDLFIEVGAGSVLSDLVRQISNRPAMSIDVGSDSTMNVLKAVGTMIAAGVELNAKALFDFRLSKPFDLQREPRFFANPCETDAPEPAFDVIPAAVPVNEPPPVDEPPTDLNPLDLIRQLVASRTELDEESIELHHRLLSDLHLNSITVGQIVTEASRRLGLPPVIAPTEAADASIAEIARSLEDLEKTGAKAPLVNAPIAGVDSWVRLFAVTEVARTLPDRPQTDAPRATIVNISDDVLAAALESLFVDDNQQGPLIVCLGHNPGFEQAGLVLASVQLAARGEGRALVLVERGAGVSSLARTLCLEAGRQPVTVVKLPPDGGDPQELAQIVKREAASDHRFSEVRYDRNGRRTVPVLQLLTPSASDHLELGRDDVLLVTGGGKGITAECALDLAKRSGCHLVILGRSDPESDVELTKNLDRLRASANDLQYLQVDLTDRHEVTVAITGLESSLGPITAVLHGAGRNQPKALSEITVDDLRATAAAKVLGLEHLLTVLDTSRLRLLIAFGSVISRTGMRGEADYALANQWLRHRVETFAAAHPQCRCHCVEWSVWSGAGMAERLGRVEALAREGITAITPEAGLIAMDQLLSAPDNELPVAVVVSGRLGDAPTLELLPRQLPLMRFLERPRVHVPGVELVADCKLNGTTDPYLDDHLYDGERLFPAVMALEAMTQAARAVSEQSLETTSLKLERPIIVPAEGDLVLRVAALVRRPGVVETVVRCSSTHFAVNHVSADFTASSPDPTAPLIASTSLEVHGFDPDSQLYDSLLFHSGRFRRISAFEQLEARRCAFTVDGDADSTWFGPYLPPTFELGDAGVRDAALHGLQAAIPHKRVLPAGVRRIETGFLDPSMSYLVVGEQRSADAQRLVWDLEIRRPDGSVCERWTGLELSILGDTVLEPALHPALVAAVVERRAGEILELESLRVALTKDTSGDRQEQSQRAVKALVGGDVTKRIDGRLQATDGLAIAVAHSADVTMAVSAVGTVGCDLETVSERSEQMWKDLLGAERLELARIVAEQASESFSAAATRIWGAFESMKKAGVMPDTPLLLDRVIADEWVVLSVGQLRAASLVYAFENEQAMVITVLGG